MCELIATAKLTFGDKREHNGVTGPTMLVGAWLDISGLQIVLFISNDRPDE
jgi:hypothetical protein